MSDAYEIDFAESACSRLTSNKSGWHSDGGAKLGDFFSCQPHAPMAGPIGNGVMSCL
jgi:hypothetical protein